MSKTFRWIGPGVLTDTIDGRATAHVGRRTDADGKTIDGDIVREHSLSDGRLQMLVDQGMAEYVGAVANVVDKITGKGKDGDDEAERAAELRRQVQETADATLRLQVLGELRRILSADVFDDDDRKLAEMEMSQAPVDKLRDFIESTQREREKRERAKSGKDKRKGEDSQPELGGAGPAGGKK